MSTTAYFAAEGFERELEDELGANLIARYGRVCLAKGCERDLAWSLNTWFEPEEIEVASIADAARKLKAKAPRWAFAGNKLHRRAELISAQLPKLKKKEFEFRETLPEHGPGSWLLLEHDRILVSARTSARIAGGEIAFVEDKHAPSRAYLKLWELFTLHGIRAPAPGELCLDLDASPGGWTWVLAGLGARVIAVDRSPLDKKLERFDNVEFRKGNAFTLKPSEIGQVDWLFSDVICFPEQLVSLVETWHTSGLARNFVCTMKFKGKTDHASAERLAKIPGSRLKHQFHNKHELTWWLVRDA